MLSDSLVRIGLSRLCPRDVRPSLGVDDHTITLLHEERGTHLETSLERNQLFSATYGIALDTRGSVGHEERRLRRQLDGDRCPIEIEHRHFRSLEEVIFAIADRLLGKDELVIASR